MKNQIESLPQSFANQSYRRRKKNHNTDTQQLLVMQSFNCIFMHAFVLFMVTDFLIHDISRLSKTVLVSGVVIHFGEPYNKIW